MLLMMSGDVEQNPGPSKLIIEIIYIQNLSICGQVIMYMSQLTWPS